MRRALHHAATFVSGIALAIAYLIAAPISVSAAPATAVIVVPRDGADAHGAAQQDPDVIPGRFVVVLKAGVSPDTVLAEHGLRATHIYRYALNGFAVAASDARANRLRTDPRVEAVGLDRIVRAFDETIPTGVNRIDAEPGKTGLKTGLGIKVLIIDTGLDYDHEDLQANIDAVHSCSFIGGTACGLGSLTPPTPPWNDGNGHGTHVGGTVAAVDNTIGVIGVAHGATLVAGKVLNDAGSGTFADITAAVDYATCSRTTDDCNGLGGDDPPIHVINMSLGATCSVCTDNSTDPTIAAFHTAVTNAVKAGIVVVVAAGNDGTNAKTTVPASFDEVITVSAFVDFNGAGGSSSGCKIFIGLGKVCDETIARFSNYGEDVDILGPGVQIRSTLPNNLYGDNSGTSMASPHVAGVVAIYLQGRLLVTTGTEVATVRSLLRSNGECAPGGSILGSGWCSKAWSGDKDQGPYWEPLVDAEKVARLATGT